MRALSLLITLLLTACTTSVKTDRLNGFEAGKRYQTHTTLFVVHWGERAELVSAYKTQSKDSGPSKVVAIPAGTRIAVIAIRGDNTLTRGVETWPEGKILTGQLAGSVVSLDAANLIDYVSEVKATGTKP